MFSFTNQLIKIFNWHYTDSSSTRRTVFSSFFPNHTKWFYFIRTSISNVKIINLMGASMGGYTTWQLAMALPELFAAIVPICGGGMYWNAPRLKDVPVWAFHGDSDPVVLPRESEQMVFRVKQCLGNAKLTIYENTEHDAWTPTFNNPEVFKWLLSNKKEQKVSPC